MNAPQPQTAQSDAEVAMHEVLDAQRADYLREGVVTAQTRIDRIDRGIDALVRYAEPLAEALVSGTNFQAFLGLQPLRGGRRQLLKT